MIITIDGPAGAGKSSAAKALARRLGFRFLDTGAMYRAVALAAMRRRIGWHDARQLAELPRQISVELLGQRVLLDGEDVTDRIRATDVTAVIHHVADNSEVRRYLVELQRQVARDENVVTEGRDQGTVAFPHADCKIFLSASPEERARRRARDLADRGEDASFERVLAQQNDRDRRDTTREVGRLVAAADAIHVLTDGLTPEQVVDRLEELARQRVRQPRLQIDDCTLQIAN